MGEYKTTIAPPALPQPFTQPTPATANLPHWAQDMHNAVAVPFWQAVISAGVWAFVAFVVVLGLFLFLPFKTAAWYVKPALVAFVTLAVWVGNFPRYWFPYRQQAMDALRQEVEWAEVKDGRDYNGDGVIGSHGVIVNGRVRRETADETVTRQWWDDVETLLARAFAERSTGEKKLVGMALTDGRRLTQDRYDVLRDAFIGSKWAHWRDAAHTGQGWTFAAGSTPEGILTGMRDGAA
jgi:hypothetical protein